MFGIGAIGGPALAQIVDHLIEALSRQSRLLQAGRGRSRAFDQKRKQQPFDRDKAVTSLLGGIFGSGKHFGQRLRKIDLAIAARNLGQLAESSVVGYPRFLGVAACAFDQRRSHALVVVEQHFQDMFGRELLMSVG
ncbi:hypothetical protein D3C73_583740 [compost metagenome]